MFQKRSADAGPEGTCRNRQAAARAAPYNKVMVLRGKGQTMKKKALYAISGAVMFVASLVTPLSDAQPVDLTFTVTSLLLDSSRLGCAGAQS